MFTGWRLFSDNATDAFLHSRLKRYLCSRKANPTPDESAFSLFIQSIKQQHHYQQIYYATLFANFIFLKI
jgi:hypothetical protein